MEDAEPHFKDKTTHRLRIKYILHMQDKKANLENCEEDVMW